jgi:hypothetical protein
MWTMHGIPELVVTSLYLNIQQRSQLVMTTTLPSNFHSCRVI